MRIPNVLVASAYGPMIVNVRDRFIGQSILQNEYWAKDEIDMLCGTMALNGLDNVRCYRAAVSDCAGETLTFDRPDYRQANNLGGLEPVPPVKSDNADLAKAGRERAPTITIDSFAVTVDLIKLDVEGMELRALEGGRHTIARDKPIIFLEFIKSDQDAIVGFFRQQGYHG